MAIDEKIVIDRTSEQFINAIDITNGASAIGNRATALGVDSVASGDGSIAIGSQAEAESVADIAIGNGAHADNGGTALGVNAEADGNATLSVGDEASATGYQSMAIGYTAEASAQQSVAVGYGARAIGIETIQIGHGENSTQGTVNIKNTTILDTNGKIPFSALQGGEVVGLAVNSSNHLIVTYANGATADLGAIGGGSGTTDYQQLTNKPQVNGITLSGNNTSADLGLQALLQSGTNIKTINGTSLLGSGDITAGIPELPAEFYAAETVGDVLSSQEIQSGIYKATQEKMFEIGNPLDLYIVPDELVIIIRELSYKRIVVVGEYISFADNTGNCDSSALYSELEGKQDTLTFDSAPTSGSTNPVTSGGVYTAQASKQDVNVQLTIGQSQTQTQTVTQWLQGLYDEVAGASAIVSQIEEVIGNGT